ncbi:hypothetical protein UE98_29895 [Burkholderia cenocepacia]|nr:hypothetical protein UE98_29895 [Burkholderia cenocepacia]
MNELLARYLHILHSRSHRSGHIEGETPERRDTRRPSKLTIESIERQVRVISRIVRDQVTPMFTHVLDFASGTGHLLFSIIATSRGGFVVIQHGVRRPEHRVTRLPDAKAEIDVVECNGKIAFVQSTQLPIQGSPYDEACTRYGGHGLCRYRARQISGLVAPQPAMQMIGAAAEPDDDTRMLYGSVRIKQFDTDDADLRTQRMSHHLVEPVSIDDFHVVVDECDELTLRQFDRAIVERGIIERTIVPEDAYAVID